MTDQEMERVFIELDRRGLTDYEQDVYTMHVGNKQMFHEIAEALGTSYYSVREANKRATRKLTALDLSRQRLSIEERVLVGNLLAYWISQGVPTREVGRRFGLNEGQVTLYLADARKLI